MSTATATVASFGPSPPTALLADLACHSWRYLTSHPTPQVGYMICDPTVEKPDLLKDRFWDEIIPQDLLYSVGSEGYGKVGRLRATARAPFLVS